MSKKSDKSDTNTLGIIEQCGVTPEPNGNTVVLSAECIDQLAAAIAQALRHELMLAARVAATDTVHTSQRIDAQMRCAITEAKLAEKIAGETE